jgi:hypothetical protein
MGTLRDEGGTYVADGYDAYQPRNKVVSKSGAYTLLGADFCCLVDASGGNITITLPAVAGISGTEYYIKKTDASVFVVTVDGNGAETIDGNTTYTLDMPLDTLHIICDGSTWNVL